jgi:hypothetical protein
VAQRKRTGSPAPKTRAELYEIAKKRDLPSRSKMGRDELARKLGELPPGQRRPLRRGLLQPGAGELQQVRAGQGGEGGDGKPRGPGQVDQPGGESRSLPRRSCRTGR